MEVTLANFAESGIQGWNHGRNNDPPHLISFNLADGKQVAKENAIFVHRVGHDGGDAPMSHEARFSAFTGKAGSTVLIDTQHCVGVADVKNQEHHSPPGRTLPEMTMRRPLSVRTRR